MTRYFLTKLEIEGFRGINNEGNPLILKFKKDAVNSVFATNGLGKSSIYDALSFTIKGCIPKIDNLPDADRGEDYYCNRFHSTGMAKIQITFTPDDNSDDVIIQVLRTQEGIRTIASPSGHPDPESFLSSVNNEFILLDHYTFMQFVEDSPLNRGRAFSALLGLSKISEFRQTLEVLSNSRNLNNDFQIELLDSQHRILKQNADDAQVKMKTAYEKLTDKELDDHNDFEEILSKATKVLKKVALLKSFFEKQNLLTVDFGKIRELIKKTESSEERERLGSVIRSINILEQLKVSEVESDEQSKLKESIEKRNLSLQETRGELFLNLYNCLNSILGSEQWRNDKKCPACESDLEESLTEKISKHIQQYEKVIENKQKIKNLWESSIWVRRFKSLCENDQIEFEKEENFSNLDEIFKYGEPTIKNYEEAVNLLSTLDTLRQSALIKLENERQKIESSLPSSLVTLTEQVEYAEQLKSTLIEIQECTKEQKEIEKKLQQRQRWQKFIEEASRIFSKAEVDLSTTQTLSLESQYQWMYSEITSNSEIVPKLKKSPGSEKLFLRLEKFYGLQDLSATTLLAESYRNALAISIYLSAAVNNFSKSRFIVLDDVTSSFDAGHQYALMELIRNHISYPMNIDGQQVIILSHDGLLEKYFDKLSNTQNWNHQRIQGLPPKGSILSQSQDANRLRTDAERFLNAGQISQGEPLIRQYLEFKLIQVIRKLDILVPLDFSIRDDRKMIQNCLDAIFHSITLHQKAGDLILEPQQVQIFQNTHLPSLISNWVNHYATGVTTNLSPYVLLKVLNTVDQMADCFKYTCNCSGTPNRRFYKSLTEKHCNC